ncbi:MAG TPA: hypothetical protein PKA37_07765 [Planctomycetota bacterium]|jgi:hypothetical protein|nr:hypothetical protein [Planctomycetota bacterium]
MTVNQDHARRVKDLHEEALFGISGVVAIDTAPSVQGGYRIRVFVTPERLLACREQIPSVLDQVPVEVIGKRFRLND